MRIPRNLIIFLTALAITDDLGAVLVIAVFYTAHLDWKALGIAAALLLVLGLLNRGGIRNPLPYWLVGILLWYAVMKSGIHATIAGIVLAMTIPARPAHTPAQFEQRIEELQSALRADRRDLSTPDDPLQNARMATIARAMERSSATVQSPLQRIEHGLTLWVTFLVIPVFALANAAIDLTSIDLPALLASSVTSGVLFGLVVGKFAGISLFSLIGVKLGWARLPAGVEWRHLLGRLAGRYRLHDVALHRATRLPRSRIGRSGQARHTARLRDLGCDRHDVAVPRREVTRRNAGLSAKSQEDHLVCGSRLSWPLPS